MIYCTSIILLLLSQVGTSSINLKEYRTEQFNSTNGPINGTRIRILNANVKQFLGIPYAKPPVGNLRFKAPEKLNGILYNKTHPYVANKLANSCPQPNTLSNVSGFDVFVPLNNITEDCLQLNIFKPNKNNGTFLVFFHGGAFYLGSSSIDIFNASVLAIKSNSIIVTVHYRLGMLGFGYLGEDSDIKGNMGLLDQQMALQWIKENANKISGHFRNNITIYGESAGAASVTAHLLSNDSHSLFDRVISSSGTITNSWATIPSYIAENNTRTVAKALNCTGNNTVVLSCLQEKNTSEILLKSATIRHPDQLPFSFAFTPIQNDSVFFKGNIKEKLIKKDIKNNSDLIIGKNANESTIFMFFSLNYTLFNCTLNVSLPIEDPINQCHMDSKALEEMAKIAVKTLNLSSTYVTNIVKLYNTSVPGNEYRDKVAKLYADITFDCDIIQFALDYANVSTTGNTYFYEFEKVSSNCKFPKWAGAVHSGELEFAFGLPFRNSSQFNDTERNISLGIMERFGNFTHYGNPRNSWGRFNSTSYNRLIIGDSFVMRGNIKDDSKTSIKDCGQLSKESGLKCPPFNSLTCDALRNMTISYMREQQKSN
uniref:Acetylcholinesterase n=1 Tax=Parastrongyloides trichosuri TaxID=131310 RepID=A0A0N4ZBE1_PARTI